MSDALIGVIIGGVIGAFPAIISSFLDSRNLARTQKHEMHMKKIELYDASRISALINYSKVLGNVSHTPKGDYLASSIEASVFVSDSTRKLIEITNEEVIAYWATAYNGRLECALSKLPELIVAIHKEMERAF